MRTSFTVLPSKLARREAISPSDNSFAHNNNSFKDVVPTSAIVHIILVAYQDGGCPCCCGNHYWWKGSITAIRSLYMHCGFLNSVISCPFMESVMCFMKPVAKSEQRSSTRIQGGLILILVRIGMILV